MTCDKDITAIFQKITYGLTVDVDPSESGKVIAEPPQPADGYEVDAEITIEAIARSEYRFSHWNGAISGSENPAKTIMDSDKQISAHFIEVPWLQRFWWSIVIGLIVVGSLVYFVAIRRPWSHQH